MALIGNITLIPPSASSKNDTIASHYGKEKRSQPPLSRLLIIAANKYCVVMLAESASVRLQFCNPMVCITSIYTNTFSQNYTITLICASIQV